MGLSFIEQIQHCVFSKNVSLPQLTFSGFLADFNTVKFEEAVFHIVHAYKFHLIKWKLHCIDYFSLKNVVGPSFEKHMKNQS